MIPCSAILCGLDPAIVPALANEGIGTACVIHAKHPGPAQFEYVKYADYVRYRMAAPPQELPSLELLDRVHALCFREFCRTVNRYATSSALINDWTDYDNLFRRAVANACTLIRRHNPDCLIFKNIPHRCATVVLCSTAQAMGIPTVICFQSQFPGHIWIVDNWTDVGLFRQSRIGEPVEIDTGEPSATPFYMDDVRNAAQKHRRAWVKYLDYSLRFLPLPFFAGSATHELRLNRILDELRHAGQMLTYCRNKKKFPRKIKDLPQSYVYAPMHLQPEMTTDMIGGRFANQAAMIARLRELVPPETPIVVKDHPKQTGLMRSTLFWSQLESIPGVLMYDGRASSHDLIRQSLATATVTGTAGWEALRFGKPVIGFGHAFWRNLPGVFHIDDKPVWSEISKHEFDARHFSTAVENLSRKLYRGVSNKRYAKIVENFDTKQNWQTLASSIAEHLRQI